MSVGDGTGHDRYGPSFWIGLGAGGLLMAWGAWLYLDTTPDVSRRLDLLRWLVGLDVAHDLVLAPAVVLVGVAVRRWVSRRWLAPVQAALIVSASVLLVALLPLRGTARMTGNPTIQPLDYRSATLTVLGAVWAVAAGWGLLRSEVGRQQPFQVGVEDEQHHEEG